MQLQKPSLISPYQQRMINIKDEVGLNRMFNDLKIQKNSQNSSNNPRQYTQSVEYNVSVATDVEQKKMKLIAKNKLIREQGFNKRQIDHGVRMNRWCNMIGLDASSKSLECERSKEDISLPKISNIQQQPAINNTNISIQKKQITAINRKVPYKNRTDSTRSQPPIPTNSYVNDLQKKYQTKLTEIDKPNINSSDCISFNGQQRSTKAKRSDQHLSFIQNRVQSVSNGTNK